MSILQCEVEGCTKTQRGRGPWCYAHYMRNYRYGSPTAERSKAKPNVDLVGQRYGALVVRSYAGSGTWVCTCDCGVEVRTRTGDLNRGGALSCGNRTIHRRRDVCGYIAVHERLAHDRGPARDHVCVECGGVASHWSYDHTDPEVLIDQRLGIPYSVDPDHYQPRCVPCHKTYDLSR